MSPQDQPPPPPGPSAIEAPETAARALADVVAAAGAVALAMFRSGRVSAWTKANDSPVTEADIAVDRFLRENLEALAPDYGWLSEESVDSGDRLDRRRVWVVDPIDGTRAFMAGGTDWAVSAALVEDGRPVAAALFAPASEEMFVAAAGRGATRNGVLISANRREELAGAAVSGPAAVLDLLAHRAEISRMPRIRSLALRIARVATGELDVAIASGNAHDWDLAAADLLVQESDAILTGFHGGVPIYNTAEPRHGALLCAGLTLHGTLLSAAKGGGE